jgi:replicative DNA helicase
VTIEHSVIGIFMRNPQEFQRALMFGLHAEMFTDELCREIFVYCVDLLKNNVTIDMTTLCLKFNINAYKIIESYDNAPVGQNADFYFGLVADSHWKKNAVLDINYLSQSIITSDPMQDASKFKVDLKAICERLNTGSNYAHKSITGSDIVQKLGAGLDERMSDFRSGKMRGISTGMKNLDAAIGRWRPGRFYVLAARPSIGKTTLALNFAIEAAKQEKHCLFFTNEMTEENLMEKILSNLSRVNGRRIEEGCLDNDEVNRIFAAMNLPLHQFIHINKKLGRYIDTIEAEARRIHIEGKLDIIFLDYIQQVGSMTASKQAQRHTVLTEITGRLESLSKELEIPIVTLAQINRAGESVTTIPSISMLKDSGSIEQDADVVMILHRDRDKFADISELKIAKNRHGNPGVFPLKSILQHSLFQEA